MRRVDLLDDIRDRLDCPGLLDSHGEVRDGELDVRLAPRLDGGGRLLVGVLPVLYLLSDLELVLGLVEGVYDLLELLDPVRRLLLVPEGELHLTARTFFAPAAATGDPQQGRTGKAGTTDLEELPAAHTAEHPCVHHASPGHGSTPFLLATLGLAPSCIRIPPGTPWLRRQPGRSLPAQDRQARPLLCFLRPAILPTRRCSSRRS